MPHAALIRSSLWLTCPFNFGAGLTFAFPASPPGQLIGLPAEVPAIYAAASGFLICLLGGMYAWMALQTEINRPMLYVGAIGKAGVFILVAALWSVGSAPLMLVFVASGDLAFATLWFWWLLAGSRSSAT